MNRTTSDFLVVLTTWGHIKNQPYTAKRPNEAALKKLIKWQKHFFKRMLIYAWLDDWVKTEHIEKALKDMGKSLTPPKKLPTKPKPPTKARKQSTKARKQSTKAKKRSTKAKKRLTVAEKRTLLTRMPGAQEDCMYCMERKKRRQVTVPCAHDFCKACYKKWCKDKPKNCTCPTCRTKMLCSPVGISKKFSKKSSSKKSSNKKSSKKSSKKTYNISRSHLQSFLRNI